MSAAAIPSLKLSAYRGSTHSAARLKLHSVLMEAQVRALKRRRVLAEPKDPSEILAQVGKLEEAPRGEA